MLNRTPPLDEETFLLFQKKLLFMPSCFKRKRLLIFQMIKPALKFPLILASFVASSAHVLAAEAVEAIPAEDAAAVPEPSVALIGGLCGILFLFWRRK